MGLLLKLAQDKLASGDFQGLSKAIPNIGELIKSAPSASGGGGLLGSLAGALGGEKLAGLAGLAGALSSLKLDPKTISKFVPVIQDFLTKQGQGELANKLVKMIPGA